MQESKITVPFRLLTDNSDYRMSHTFVDHPLLDGYVHCDGQKAKDKLRAEITEQIEEGLRARKNVAARAIGTVDGAVFIIRWAYDGWNVAIAGPGRKFAGSSSGYASLEDATERAKKHIADSFGGVAWECSL